MCYNVTNFQVNLTSILIRIVSYSLLVQILTTILSENIIVLSLMHQMFIKVKRVCLQCTVISRCHDYDEVLPCLFYWESHFWVTRITWRYLYQIMHGCVVFWNQRIKTWNMKIHISIWVEKFSSSSWEGNIYKFSWSSHWQFSATKLYHSIWVF